MQWGVLVLGLTALAWQLPGPAATATALTRHRSATTGGVADAAMLAVAALAVWLLLSWIVLAGVVAVAGRLPGVVGTAARAGLVVVAPVAMRNALLTVVGASVVTGLAGCAGGVGPAPGIPASSGISSAAGAALSAAAAPAATAAAPDATATAAPAATAASQLRAERLIGIATLRISDRIAVEGSAVRSAAASPTSAAPAGTGRTGSGLPGTGRAVPGLDWPATAGGSAGTATAPATRTPAAGVPATSFPSRPPAGRTAVTAAVPTPPVTVDWPGPAARGMAAAGSVVVLRGDSLWGIAARSLPDGSDDATIDRTWHAWYAANAAVIGSDPDYLLPGQILQPPTAHPGTVDHR